MINDRVAHTNSRMIILTVDQRIRRLESTIKSIKSEPEFANSNYLKQLKKQLNDLKNGTG